MTFGPSGPNQFEIFSGQESLILEMHPHEPFGIAAVPIKGSGTHRTIVWNTQSREIAWAPPDVYTMAWCRDGKEIVVVCEQDFPTSGEVREWERAYTWKRYCWPNPHLLSSYPFARSTNFFTHLAISPRSNLAACLWNGWDWELLSFVALSEEGDAPLIDFPFPPHEHLSEQLSNGTISGYVLKRYCTTCPIFSPQGRYLIIGWEEEWYWWPGPDEEEDAFYDEEDPEQAWEEMYKAGMPKGDCHFGWVAVFDWDRHRTSTIRIAAPIPSDWRPPAWGQEAAEMCFDDPIFLDETHFRLRLPTGEQAVYSIP